MMSIQSQIGEWFGCAETIKEKKDIIKELKEVVKGLENYLELEIKDRR